MTPHGRENIRAEELITFQLLWLIQTSQNLSKVHYLLIGNKRLIYRGINPPCILFTRRIFPRHYFILTEKQKYAMTDLKSMVNYNSIFQERSLYASWFLTLYVQNRRAPSLFLFSSRIPDIMHIEVFSTLTMLCKLLWQWIWCNAVYIVVLKWPNRIALMSNSHQSYLAS